MPLNVSLVRYEDLNSQQKENFNFLKVSAVLADYGFMTLRLTDDWQGADFIAQHIDGETFLKGRLSFDRKYCGKELYVAFRDGAGAWYLYPHDELLKKVLRGTGISDTVSWSKRGGYPFRRLSRQLKEMLRPYRIEAQEAQGHEPPLGEGGDWKG